MIKHIKTFESFNQINEKEEKVGDKPVISSLSKFKEAIRKSELSNAYTGENKVKFNLIYGFKGNNLYIEANNIKDAYKEYKNNFEKYDKYIPMDSFLRD